MFWLVGVFLYQGNQLPQWVRPCRFHLCLMTLAMGHCQAPSKSSVGMLALVPASYALSPDSVNTISMPLVPSVVSLHSVQSVSEPLYARAMASSTVSASTVLVNSVTSYATTVNIISAPSE